MTSSSYIRIFTFLVLFHRQVGIAYDATKTTYCKLKCGRVPPEAAPCKSPEQHVVTLIMDNLLGDYIFLSETMRWETKQKNEFATKTIALWQNTNDSRPTMAARHPYRSERDNRENWAVVGHALVVLNEQLRKHVNRKIQDYHMDPGFKVSGGPPAFRDPSGCVHYFKSPSGRARNDWNRAMGKKLGHPASPAEEWPGDQPPGSTHHMFALTFLQP